MDTALNVTKDMEDDVPKVIPVTKVRVFPFPKPQGNIEAMASVVIGGQFELTGLRIMNGVNGLFVAYPADPFYKNKDYRSIYSPVTRQQRELVEAKVLEKYQSLDL